MSKAEISSDSHPRRSHGKRCMVKEGVTSHAICCHAPSLECQMLENIAEKNQVSSVNVTIKISENPLLEVTSKLFFVFCFAVFVQVQLSCPSDWTLTDCSAVSRGSAILGSVAKGNSCHVHGATGVDGAVGIAVCCRVAPPEQQAATPH